jgi:hypothetical protein
MREVEEYCHDEDLGPFSMETEKSIKLIKE